MQAPWRDELRATLALAWPLILANLTMAAHPGDRRRADGLARAARQLAASALALNLTFACILFALGRGHRLVADDGDRARRSGPTRCATCGGPSASRCGRSCMMTVPTWLIVLWNAERSSCALARSPALARDAGLVPARLHVGRCCRACCSRRCATSSRRSSGRAGCWRQRCRASAQRAAQLGADLRPFRACRRSAFSAAGSAARSSGRCMALALAIVILTDRQFRRFHLFGRFWRADWPRFRAAVPARHADRADHGVRRRRCSAPPPI